jgi:beta-N-acetylhexosaminidase
MEDYRGPDRLAIARRRAIALAVAAGVVAVVAILLIGGGDEGSDEPDPLAGISSETAAQVQEMTPEQLADQVLLLGFEGTDASAAFLDDVRSRELGGVFVDTPNWTGAASGTALVAALRAAGREDGRIPPLIVAAQEGGRYRAFDDLPPEQTELELGDSGSVDAAEDWARQTAQSLRSAGFDLNLSPVADIATLDSPIADRAFSDDGAEVIEMTAAAIRGCTTAGLACAALHFPGLGAASEDTDHGPATVGLDAATIESRDAAPFAFGIAEGMPAVVLSLAFYAAYDAVTPAALSEPVATRLLRDQLGFSGVAITDDLGAGAVRSGYSVPKAAVAALAAGSDLIQIDSPEDQKGVAEAIATAVESGELDESRLQQAAARVLELKRVRGLTPM